MDVALPHSRPSPPPAARELCLCRAHRSPPGRAAHLRASSNSKEAAAAAAAAAEEAGAAPPEKRSERRSARECASRARAHDIRPRMIIISPARAPLLISCGVWACVEIPKDRSAMAHTVFFLVVGQGWGSPSRDEQRRRYPAHGTCSPVVEDWLVVAYVGENARNGHTGPCPIASGLEWVGCGNRNPAVLTDDWGNEGHLPGNWKPFWGAG